MALAQGATTDPHHLSAPAAGLNTGPGSHEELEILGRK